MGSEKGWQTVVLGDERYWCRLVYGWSFDKGLGGWFIEGESPVYVENGRLYMDATTEVSTVSTAWCPRVFEGDLILEFDACVVPPERSSNINFFMYASELDGGDVLDNPRPSGAYKLYHNINNYIFTFVNDKGKGRYRMRRCPGFKLIHEVYVDHPAIINKVYHIQISKIGGRIRYFVDGEKIHDYVDEKPHNRGRMAFRTFRTKLWWNNLKVYQEITRKE